MKKPARNAPKLQVNPLGTPLLLATGLCLILYSIRVMMSGTWHFWFLGWNLLLAWVPLLLAILLVRSLHKRRWLSPINLSLTALWIIFLPNTFYLVTDFIHLEEFDSVTLLFDVVMLMTFALTGLVLGWIAVYLVHRELKKRKSRDIRWILLGFVFMLCSFAIYMGRNLGWNSWDIIANPFGITLDILQRLSYPNQYPDTYSISSLFFIYTSGTYLIFYTVIKALNSRSV